MQGKLAVADWLSWKLDVWDPAFTSDMFESSLVMLAAIHCACLLSPS